MVDSAPIHVLLVEDNPTDALLTRDSLSSLSQVTVKTTERLSEAVTLLKQEPVDIVLLDLGLPDSQGLGTLAEIRRHVPYSPVVVLTGNDDETLGLQALNHGAQDYLVKKDIVGMDVGRAVLFALERNRLTQALQESEERFRMMVEGVKDYAIYSMDNSGRITTWNEGGLRLSGYAPEEVIGKHYSLFFSEEDKRDGAPEKELAHAAEHGTVMEERWRVRKDGTRFWANGVLTALYDRAGGLRGYCKVARDLTERRTASERHRAVVETAFDGIITINERGLIQSVNPSAENLFGYSASELLGQNVKLLMPEPYHSEHDTYLSRASSTNERKVIGKNRNVMGRRKDGSTFPIELAISVFFVNDRRQFTGFIRDMSERKAAEEQLRQSQKMEAVGQLAGGVAHDFNNLLTIISGYSEIMLSMLPSTDPMRGSVKAISEAGERAAALTRQLLAFSRKTVLEPKVLDVNDIIKEVAKFLRRLIGENILLTPVLDPNLNPVKVDPGQMEQVLMNLAVNARDAMPRGGKLTIETCNIALDERYVATHSECTPGQYVRVTMTDTGEGMTPEIKARIFEPFFTTKPVGKGTGLGLSMVFGIIKQSGGCIDVYSEPGFGTTFKIYLPAVVEPIPAPRSRESNRGVGGTETLLLVEDEDGVRGLALLVLQSYGYKVLDGRNGKEALHVVEKHQGRIDLLVTDVVMPDMDGRDLADVLRHRFPHLKVLFSSGYTDDAVVRHGILHEEASFLQKPYTPLALAKKVREVLDKK